MNLKTEFFRINFPYGIEKTDKGRWRCFNREYSPLGFDRDEISIESYPKGLEYNISEKLLLFLADKAKGDNGVRRNSKGEIVKVFLYSDCTNPADEIEFWEQYAMKLKALTEIL